MYMGDAILCQIAQCPERSKFFAHQGAVVKLLSQKVQEDTRSLLGADEKNVNETTGEYFLRLCILVLTLRKIQTLSDLERATERILPVTRHFKRH